MNPATGFDGSDDTIHLSFREQTPLDPPNANELQFRSWLQRSLHWSNVMPELSSMILPSDFATSVRLSHVSPN